MQTAITEQQYAHPDAKIAESILTSCVHCGFCNATCPTYQLEGVEMEGPRGRIYLIKSLLEDKISHEDSVVSHLDSCLSCLACETTCPSGVRYSHLIDSARSKIAEQYQRAAVDGLQRRMLAWLLPYPSRFRLAMLAGRLAKPFAFTELLARVNALLRRGRTSVAGPLVVGTLILDPATRQVTHAGHEVVLTAKEFDLLEYLARAEGQVVSRDALARDVWKETARSTTLDNVIDVHVSRLRRKIMQDPPLLQTVRGVGFVIRDDTP